jgi:signal transduction histidine kinase
MVDEANTSRLAPPAPAQLGSVEQRKASTKDLGEGALFRGRRRTLRFSALLIASCYFIDFFQPRLAEVAVVRAGWIVVVLVAAAWQWPDGPRRALLGAYLASIATGAAVVAIIALQGGTSSIYSGMLIATPFAVLVTLAEFPSVAALNGAICALGGAAMRLSEGHSRIQVVCWLLLATVMSALATWGTVGARRAWRAEVGAERERLMVLEQLAESERQRAVAERLAVVGELAARVAHEVNNPLAAVKSNVQWLGCLETRGDPEEQAEVVADTLASVDRIVEAVNSVRRSSGERLFSGQ